DHPLLQVREVPDRLVADLATLPIGAPQQRGLVLPAVVVATRRRHMNLAATLGHRQIIPHQATPVKLFSVYITQSRRSPIPANTGDRASEPQKLPARGRLAPPRNALRRFTFVRHHDASTASFRPALTEAPQRNQPHWDRP